MARALSRVGVAIAIMSAATVERALAEMPVIDIGSITQLSSVVSNGTQMLGKLQSLSGEMNTLNSVMGGKIPDGLMNGLNQFSQYTGDFGGLVDSLTSGNGDPLGQMNGLANQHGGTRDFSDVLYAKDYFKSKFFQDETHPVSINQFEKIQENRAHALEESTISSFSLAAQQKESLKESNESLKTMSDKAAQDDSIQYQTNVQTQLLKSIAHRLDRLILIQSQQLELMSSVVAQSQPAVFKRSGGTSKNKGEK